MLASALMVLFDPVKQLKKSRDSQRKAELKQIQTGLELYRADNNGYPNSSLVTCRASLTANGVTYISKIPCDPRDPTTTYVYTPTAVSGINTSYTLYACIEYRLDPDPDVKDFGSCPTGKRYLVNSP